MAGMKSTIDAFRRPAEIGSISDSDGMLVTTTTGDEDEEPVEIPLYQQYGFASRPDDPDANGEAQGVLFYRHGRGNGALMLCADDGRYRVAIDKGEVVVYHKSGASVLLNKDGDIILAPAAGRNIDLAGDAHLVARKDDPVTTNMADAVNLAWDAFFSALAAAVDTHVSPGVVPPPLATLYNTAKASAMGGKIADGSTTVRTS